MNPKLCVVFSVLFVLVSVSESRVNLLDIYSEKVFEYAVLRNQRPVVVFFTKPSCAPCRNTRRLLETFGKENSKTMDVAIVDLEKRPELREQFAINAIPTTRAFNKGELMGEVKGPGWKSIEALAKSLIE